MNARPCLSILIGFIAASVGACSSSDTILALTVTSGADTGPVAKLHVTVTPASGSPATFDFTPPPTEAGTIAASVLERIKLPSGVDGPCDVAVEGQNTAGTTIASGRKMTTIVKNEATAVSVMLMPGALPPLGTDGGTDGAQDGGGDATRGNDGGADVLTDAAGGDGGG